MPMMHCGGLRGVWPSNLQFLPEFGLKVTDGCNLLINIPLIEYV